MNSIELILASKSPRRKQLLKQVGLSFSVDSADIDEAHIDGEKAEDYVLRLSQEKTRVVAQRAKGGVVLAADTIVVFGGAIFGKPESRAHCIEMLRRLSASTHEVMTGVTVTNNSRRESFLTTTRVIFREISMSEIMWYWETGEPEDKAGAYGLQGRGAAFVSAIHGSFSNVIGLPLAETLLLLREFDVNAMQNREHRINYAPGGERA